MATAKKASDKKSSGKKAASAAKKGSPKKVSKKSGVGNPLLIQVPRGGQVVKFFELTPTLPVEGKAGDWVLVESNIRNCQPITSVTVGFLENPSEMERELERAVLIVSLNQATPNGIWRFALGGVATDQADSDPNNDIVVELIDNGLTMIVYVHVLENSVEHINFGYVASFTDAVSGVVSIYESQDPGIIPIRPIVP